MDEGKPAKGSIPSVTVFPMRKVKKESRVEHEVVCVTEWRGSNDDRRWLLVKRPEKGGCLPYRLADHRTSCRIV